jgi:dihydrodipicolinate synthase/N-acetylneuraminate lyase
MLALKSFKIVVAIIAHFDFKIKQYNVINAFINAIRSSDLPLVIYKLPLGFKVLKYVAEVDRALYSLRDSPAL